MALPSDNCANSVFNTICEAKGPEASAQAVEHPESSELTNACLQGQHRRASAKPKADRGDASGSSGDKMLRPMHARPMARNRMINHASERQADPPT